MKTRKKTNAKTIDKKFFCYVSWFAGFYGWCENCQRVMFFRLRFTRYVPNLGVRKTARCEECGEVARLAEGEPINLYWQEYHRVN